MVKGVDGGRGQGHRDAGGQLQKITSKLSSVVRGAARHQDNELESPLGGKLPELESVRALGFEGVQQLLRLLADLIPHPGHSTSLRALTFELGVGTTRCRHTLKDHTSFTETTPGRNTPAYRGFASKRQSTLDGLAPKEHGSGARCVAPQVTRKAAADAGAGPENAPCAEDRNGALLPAQPLEQGQAQVPELASGFLAQKTGHGVAPASCLHDYGNQCGNLSLRQVLCRH